MGIQDGTKIKAHLRGLDCGILTSEKIVKRTTQTYMDSQYWIIDCMLDIYTKPPYVMTGRQLTRWYFNKILPALFLGKTVVLIYDDSRMVPQNKAACQQKRRSKAPKLPDGLTIKDDETLPDWYSLLSSGKYRLMIFEYLLMGLSSHVSGMTTEHSGVLFVSKPWSRQSLYDTDWLSGGVVELTSTGSPTPPGPKIHGEGDMLCRVWSDFFGEKNPNAKIVIRSKDLDMLGIYAARPPLGDCSIHITSSPKSYEFIRVKPLHLNLLRTRERALGFTYALILAGSDFCEGIKGISGSNLVKTTIETQTEDQPLYFNGKRPKICKKRLNNLMNKACRRSKKGFSINPHRLAFCRANWNLDYWMSMKKIPDPLKYGGWRKEDGGFMPISQK
jgi:hypothetical protein